MWKRSNVVRKELQNPDQRSTNLHPSTSSYTAGGFNAQVKSEKSLQQWLQLSELWAHMDDCAEIIIWNSEHPPPELKINNRLFNRTWEDHWHKLGPVLTCVGWRAVDWRRLLEEPQRCFCRVKRGKKHLKPDLLASQKSHSWGLPPLRDGALCVRYDKLGKEKCHFGGELPPPLKCNKRFPTIVKP